MNKIQLVGRLTKEPELNYAANSGTAITKFTLAVKRPRFDKSKDEEADFINCVCIGKKAEVIANFVQKGHLFGISGRLQIKKYVDKDNNNRYSTDVIVEDFEFLQSGNKNNANASTGNNNQSRGSSGGFSADTFDMEMTPVDDGDIPF